MATATELDFALASFWEFARIWKAGNRCKLVLSCFHGQGEVQVVAGLQAADHPHPPLQNYQAQRHLRTKSPSQLRREERRRIERLAAKATDAERTEKVEDSAEDEKAEEGNSVHANVVAEKASNIDKETDSKEKMLAEIAKEVTDEICTDAELQDYGIDAAEAARDKMVDKVCPVGNFKLSKEEFENDIKSKFGGIGILVKEMEIKKTWCGEIKGCIVETSPVNLDKIWGRRLGILDCSIISFYQ